MSDLLDRLADIEWDVLIVLDALRYDHTPVVARPEAESADWPEKAWSPASCTMEWVKAIFRHSELREKLAETACITANPEVTRWSAEYLWAERDDLWARAWEHVNGLGTVRPEDVTQAVQAELTVGPDRPVYAHYAQPHGPYPLHDPPVPVMRNNPQASEVVHELATGETHDADDIEMPDHIIMDPAEQIADPDHWLTFDVLRKAYISNVEWAMAAIQPLLDGDRTVVVTADHGELLGEDDLYGHPPGDDHDKLREVPLAVYEP